MPPGNLPLGPKTPEAMHLSAEQALEDKLVSTLEPVTGAGNVRASVTLDYDQTATDETAESYDPDKTATLSMQRTEQTTGAQPVAAGVPGTASNAPNSQALPVYPQRDHAAADREDRVGHLRRLEDRAAHGRKSGRVRRLTAAIVVNDRLSQPATKNQAAVWQPRSADELRNLTALAQAAVGFDPTRGDVVTVQDLAFDDNRAQPPVAARRADSECGGELAGAGEICRAAAGPALWWWPLRLRPAIRHAGAALADARTAEGREQGVGRSASAAALSSPEPAPTRSGAAAHAGDLRAGDAAI